MLDDKEIKKEVNGEENGGNREALEDGTLVHRKDLAQGESRHKSLNIRYLFCVGEMQAFETQHSTDKADSDSML